MTVSVVPTRYLMKRKHGHGYPRICVNGDLNQPASLFCSHRATVTAMPRTDRRVTCDGGKLQRLRAVRRNTHGGETGLHLRAVRKNTHEGRGAQRGPRSIEKQPMHCFIIGCAGNAQGIVTGVVDYGRRSTKLKQKRSSVAAGSTQRYMQRSVSVAILRPNIRSCLQQQPANNHFIFFPGD